MFITPVFYGTNAFDYVAQKVTRNEAGAQSEAKTQRNTIKVLIKQEPKIPRVERFCNAPNAHRAEGGGETEKRTHG